MTIKRDIWFTQQEINEIEKAAARIDELARVAEGDGYTRGLVEADEERALLEMDMTELLIRAAARSGLEV